MNDSPQTDNLLPELSGRTLIEQHDLTCEIARPRLEKLNTNHAATIRVEDAQ